MGGQRQSSRDGGYVGGFLQLFDWNAKSRKKLFSNKSDNPDHSKQKKRSDGNLPMTRFNPVEMDVDEYVEASTFNGSSEYSYASSMTDDEGFGSKAPNVVARLMGLDTMPTSNLAEPFSTPYLDTQSLQESKYIREKLVFHRPIEKFQSEILPPKSAKTIPITHHKLLSPIKGPSFISSKNAAHIMEAAAKIIEREPQTSTSKTKMPSVGKSSVPFKVKELREKVEASQKPSRRPVESNAAKILKGQPMNKSWNGSADTEDRNNKAKSISLALQAKVNVQKREGTKEPREMMLSQSFKSKSSCQKSMPKKSTSQHNSGALKQNNQKQNCAIEKEKLNPKSSLSKPQSRLKISSGDSSSGRHKSLSKCGGNSKVGSRKLSPEANDSKEEVLYSNTRNVPRKRRSLDGNFSKEKSQTVDSMLIDSDEKPVQSSIVENKRKDMDVVSFTFTAPLSRQNNMFDSDFRNKKAMLSSDTRNSGKQSLVDCNVIGADNISILLEQKLRDLTHGPESSRYRDGFYGNSAPIFQEVAPTPKEVASIPMPCKHKNQDAAPMDISSPGKHKLQGKMEVEVCKSDDTETRKSLHYRLPSPISVLDSSFMTESWNSSDLSNYIEGSKQGSSIQALQVLGMNTYRNNPHLMELDTELTDSASSSSIKTIVKGKMMHISMTSEMGSNWELQYVREILFNVELMFKDFALGRARKIINPHLFNQLENKKEVAEGNLNDNKLGRKVLFDCVSECMDIKCSRYSNVGFRTWTKGLSTVRGKERLADDVYKEISGWKGMENSIVDDIVDKDMSSQYGKWLDFEVEVFELGFEIEGWLLNSLINEVVIDLVI